MPSRHPSPEHEEAVARRLALLSAELAGVRPAAVDPDVGAEDRARADAWAAPHTRIRPDARPQLPPASPPEPPPDVPVPGRHASRRAGALVGAVPAPLRGRVAIGPAQLTVVVLLLAAGLAVTCWWVVRGDADRLQAPAIRTSGAALTSEAPVSPRPSDAAPVAATTPTGTVTVDVTGKVRRPGIAALDAGARVVDALEAAGGARPGVDLSGLNLARVLVDGEQVVVGAPAPTGLEVAAVPSPGAVGAPLVDLNTASQTELEALPEVGPVTAQAILSWRTEHGGFTAVDELLEVDGIGDATLEQLAPYVTV
jgi:competence protein ComEA